MVFLDDDGVVDDADFLQKAMYGLGKLTKKGIPILAKTGFCFNSGLMPVETRTSGTNRTA